MENTLLDQNTIIAPPPIEPIQPQSSTSPKSHSIFIGLALVLFGTLIGVLASRLLPMSGTATAPSVTPTVALTTTPTIDETANWKIYTDTKLNYSIQYPKNWNMENVCFGKGFANDNYLCLESPDLVINPALVVTSGELITIYGPGSSAFINGTLTVDSYCQQQPLVKITSCNSIVVGGKDAIERVILDPPLVDIAIVNNKQIMFFIESRRTSQVTPTIFDQILSTFKFTDQSNAEGKFCGGFAGIVCPDGYSCKYDGKYPDAGGICTKK